MISRRQFTSAGFIAAVAARGGMGVPALGAVLGETGSSDVLTIATPVVIEDGIIVDHYRITTSTNGDGSAVVLGSIVSVRDGAVAIPDHHAIEVRDRDGKFLANGIPQHVYPILPPGKSIGFVALFENVSADDIDPEAIEFAYQEFLADAPIIDELAIKTVAIESQDIISQRDDLKVEYVLRNTSAGLNEIYIDARVAVWDAEWLFCGTTATSVLNGMSPGETIRFTTHSSQDMNPLALAGSDFTLDPWMSTIPADYSGK